MELSFWAATDVGKKREVNEDNFLVDKKLSLFIVADGMGGHASGEVASHLAVHELRNTVDAGRDVVDRFTRDAAAVRPQEILTLLEHAVQTAGHTIYQRGVSEPEKRGMGTTTSALLIAGDRGFIAHVGDSRIYMVRGGQVVQLTEDHSLINELIRRGRITRENLEDSPPYKAYKNAVTRAVGVYETVQGDTIDFEILQGDTVPDLFGRAARVPDRAADSRLPQDRRPRGPSPAARRPRQRGRRPRQHHGHRRPRRGRRHRRPRRGAGPQGGRPAPHAAVSSPHL